LAPALSTPFEAMVAAEVGLSENMASTVFDDPSL
jgi:hypothetical protein